MEDGIAHETGRRYPQPRGRQIAARALALVCVLGAAAPLAADGGKLRPNGRWRRFHVKAAGGHEAFLFRAHAGVRYRVTVEGRTLARPVVELYAGRSETPVEATRAPAEGPARIQWRPRRATVAEVRIAGFSLATGKGRVKLEPLDWHGRPTRGEERWLGAADEPGYVVGELVLGQRDTWHLAVEPGGRYEVLSSHGGVARVRLRVRAGDDADAVVADSAAWWRPHATSRVRFAAPTAADGAAPALELEVAAVWPSAGSYGLRMRRLEDGEGHAPPEPLGLPDAEAAPVEGAPLQFTLGEGDMAVLWVPAGHPMPQRAVLMEVRGTWIPVEGAAAGERDLGRIARGRRPGSGSFQSFRPYQAGTYRFTALGRRAARPETLRLYTREELGPPPVHMGTASDPDAKARLTRRWTPVGLGICVPDVTYLFVCRGAPGNVSMRVRTLDGKTVARRSNRAVAPGYGPSMRFRVDEPTVVRLEARGRHVVSALLRELLPDGG